MVSTRVALRPLLQSRSTVGYAIGHPVAASRSGGRGVRYRFLGAKMKIVSLYGTWRCNSHDRAAGREAIDLYERTLGLKPSRTHK